MFISRLQIGFLIRLTQIYFRQVYNATNIIGNLCTLVFTIFIYNSNMNYPYIQGISDIQQTQIAYSRATNLSSPTDQYFNALISNNLQNLNEPSLLENNTDSMLDVLHTNNSANHTNLDSCVEYIERTLSGMGLKIGELEKTEQNTKTIECFLALIKKLNDQQEDKVRLKEQLNEANFQKNKYVSLLQQSRKAIQDKDKKLGTTQNNYQELRNKLKKLQKDNKKQKDEDRKAIAMLKSKNQQIMHQVKKKQNEVNRVKEQMKKNITSEKQSSKATPTTFEVYEPFKKKSSDNEAEDRASMLAQKFQRQRKTIVRQNLLLKEKLYDIREEIVHFAEWIDSNVFGEKNSYANKFIINHNLLFRKESIVDEFNEILNDAKSGIQDVMLMHLNRNKEDEESGDNLTLKKSVQNGSKSSLGTPKMMRNPDKKAPMISSCKIQEKRQPRKTEPLQRQEARKKSIQPIMNKNDEMYRKQECLLEGEEQSQLSMISHISMNQMAKESNKNFEKWDILFNDHDL